MRQQHNSNGSRNCWKTARERNRLQARFAIRERVKAQAVAYDENNNNHELMEQVLCRIVQGDRSFFSLKFMAENFELLSLPVSVDTFLLDKNGNLTMEQKILSRFGKQKVKELKDLFNKHKTCTLMEFATLLGRFPVLHSLLLGGINPGHRGIPYDVSEETEVDDAYRTEILSLGAQFLQQLFERSVPLSLASYMVKRVIDFRTVSEGEQNTDVNDHTCNLCHCKESSRLLLSSEGLCRHIFCESCLWKNLIEHRLDAFDATDIVDCPLCSTGKEQQATNSSTSLPAEERQKRRLISLDKYQSLPLDPKALKCLSSKKKPKLRDEDSLCSSWSTAVVASLGRSQAVRRDKFFANVEKGSYAYIKGFLEHGIDVNLCNEYGQSAVFISAWRGRARIVQLLLDWGADPYLVANGGMTAKSVAASNGHARIIQILCEYGVLDTDGVDQFSRSEERPNARNTSNYEVSVLIDSLLDHPGAGSFIVDKVISEDLAEKLVLLHRSIPIAENSKVKDIPCSVRSYFCDAQSWLRARLEKVIADVGVAETDEGIRVLPHMRFLCYKEPGAVLAKHVDLCRLDPVTNERSTHTMILYLEDCTVGGETSLLKDLSPTETILASVHPERARLFLFPHQCPHAGEEVQSVPKLLIRGEVCLPVGYRLRSALN